MNYSYSFFCVLGSMSILGLHSSLSPCSIIPCCYAIGVKYMKKPYVMLFYFENIYFLHLSAPEEIYFFLLHTQKKEN